MESLQQQKKRQTILTRFSNSTKAEEYSEHVPEDLIIEILLRLPTKSIARCRCVSKIWTSILSSQDFTDTFLKRSLARPKILFACGKDSGELLLFSSPQPRNTDENSSFITANYHMNLPRERLWSVIHISGLVCIRENAFVWNICNPSTRQYFTLPDPGVKIEINSRRRTFFGYDPIGKQVKVLTMTWEYGDYSYMHQVLTLETDKMSWRRIECGTPHSDIFDDVCISGVLYYTAYGKASCKVSMIVCFDVRSEKYKFIRVMESSIGAVNDKTTLINYKGKLASLRMKRSYGYAEANISFDLWVLQDLEKQEWSKHTYKFPLSRNEIIEDKFYCTGVTAGTNEIVLFRNKVCDPFYVFYYNIERKTIKRVEIQGLPKVKGMKVFISLDHIEDVKLM